MHVRWPRKGAQVFSYRGEVRPCTTRGELVDGREVVVPRTLGPSDPRTLRMVQAAVEAMSLQTGDSELAPLTKTTVYI